MKGARPAGRAALSYVSLEVADLGRAVRFYRKTLGLEPLKLERTMAFFPLGSIRLALLLRSALAREAGITLGVRARAGARRAGSGGVLLSLNVGHRAEVAASLRRAVAAGGRILRPAATPSWAGDTGTGDAGGGRTGVFADPDGHLWEVAWNPRFRFEPGRKRTAQKSN